MKSEACLHFFKDMLGELASHGRWGTHSAKITVLSWCSKAGMAKESRKLLDLYVSIASNRTVV